MKKIYKYKKISLIIVMIIFILLSLIEFISTMEKFISMDQQSHLNYYQAEVVNIITSQKMQKLKLMVQEIQC